ncbi:MAG: hypothetical protein LKJ90_00245 [Faecalibacterium sp.]|jgi:pilin isopeptide linkage protein|nr:hypothetical protein [Faecalibacterium sp.]
MVSGIQKGSTAILAWLLACLCLLYTAPAAFADAAASVSIPVRCGAVAASGQAAEYRLELAAGGADTPMPGGKQGGTAQLTCTGGSSVSFGPISYAGPGTFYYSLRQLPGSAANVHYDGTIYDLTVFVAYQQDGTLAAKLTASCRGGSGKATELLFQNRIAGAPQTGDTANLTPPAFLALASLGVITAAAPRSKKKK